MAFRFPAGVAAGVSAASGVSAGARRTVAAVFQATACVFGAGAGALAASRCFGTVTPGVALAFVRKNPASRSSRSEPCTASTMNSTSVSVCAVERKKLRHSQTCTPRSMRWW
ncbi:hypothetical protein SALBM135S_04077 [Streptomyces alboniger]